MEKKLYIVRCGEVALKGMNKPYFERILIERLRGALSCFEDAEAKWIDGLMFVRVPADIPEDEVIAKCVRVFGVASVSPAVEAPKDINAIGRTAAAYMQKVIEEDGVKTFKVKAHRADKSFAVESPDIARQVGGMVLKANQGLSVVGYASVRDTAAINRIIYGAVAKQVLPSDLKLLWSAKPADVSAKNIFELHALKVTTTNGRAPLEGDVVTDASDQFNNITGQPEVSMTMNSDGARRWAELTKANVGKAIAIVLDGVVYSAPRVNGEIDGGQSSISGNFTIEDTKDLANTLKSGRMPAPAHS